jgi:hypothetical protein
MAAFWVLTESPYIMLSMFQPNSYQQVLAQGKRQQLRFHTSKSSCCRDELHLTPLATKKCDENKCQNYKPVTRSLFLVQDPLWISYSMINRVDESISEGTMFFFPQSWVTPYHMSFSSLLFSRVAIVWFQARKGDVRRPKCQCLTVICLPDSSGSRQAVAVLKGAFCVATVELYCARASA